MLSCAILHEWSRTSLDLASVFATRGERTGPNSAIADAAHWPDNDLPDDRLATLMHRTDHRRERKPPAPFEQLQPGSPGCDG